MGEGGETGDDPSEVRWVARLAAAASAGAGASPPPTLLVGVHVRAGAFPFDRLARRKPSRTPIWPYLSRHISDTFLLNGAPRADLERDWTFVDGPGSSHSRSMSHFGGHVVGQEPRSARSTSASLARCQRACRSIKGN